MTLHCLPQSSQVKQLHGLSIERAAAAARKRVNLLPGDMGVQLQLALLCYFCGHYDDAWLELGTYIEAVRRLTGAQDITAAAAAAVTVAATVKADTEAIDAHDGELADVLLLFEKLQLELMMGPSSTE